MKITLALCSVALVAMAVLLYFQSTTIKELELTVRKLSAKTSERPPTASLELQGKCSDQARKAFKDLGYKSNDLVAYQNHYNPELNICSVEVEHADTKGSTPEAVTFRNVFDAFEGKAYGTYAWRSQKDKKFWEVSPFMCEVVLPSGEKKQCHSNDEFTELVKVYMQGGR